MRYETISRFLLETILNLSIVIWINFIFGGFDHTFDAISYIITWLVSLIIFVVILYWLIYPIKNYENIISTPEKHERHKMLFSELRQDNQRNLLFYSILMIYRFIFALVIVWMYNHPTSQCISLWFINIVIVFYTKWSYKDWLNNFLYLFNCWILIAFNLCLPLFLKPNNPQRLETSGYVSKY